MLVMKRGQAVFLLRLALVSMATSLLVFLFTAPSLSPSSSSSPSPRQQQGGGPLDRDPFPWEVPGEEMDDITEFRGPKRNLQQTQALVDEDVFTDPLLTTTTHSTHTRHQRSKYNYTGVQQVRQRALDTACREQTITRETWSDLTQSQRSALADRMIVDEEHKLLFCPVPLTAIGPWMKVFYLLGRGQHLQSADEVPASELSHRENFVYLSSFPPEEQEKKVERYLKFMVTRHPFFRLAVAYKMKFESDNAFFHERYGREIVQLYRSGATGEETGSDVKFSEFVEYLLHLSGEGEMNEHWRPLHSLCLPCQMSYDYILHYETLAADSKELLREAGLLRLVPSLPRDTWDYMSTQYIQSLFQQVTPAWIGQLVHRYQNDFDAFSYGSIFDN